MIEPHGADAVDVADDPPGEQAPATPAPLLTLREPLPPVTADQAGLEAAAERIRRGTGPVAVDAERASGYRYSSRAYLIQLRREGSGTVLVDPLGLDLAPLGDALVEPEWILHAASQDLPCLREVGLVPSRLFDTELAARLLGHPRVGLATLVETLQGRSLRKEHSAVDWSQRPLPEPWLEYAALDVEVLVELRDLLDAELEASGKAEWARQEFEHLLSFRPLPREEPWRRTSGIHKARGRRALAAVRELWQARDRLAEQSDTTPSRLIPDSAIVAAANALPQTRSALLATTGFHGRGAKRHAADWVDAVRRARELDAAELPPATRRVDGPPQMRLWADRDPVAAARLATARERIAAFCEEHAVPAENLLTPDYLRRVLWRPPATDGDVEEAVSAELRRIGARTWQIEITAPIIAGAIIAAEQAGD